MRLQQARLRAPGLLAKHCSATYKQSSWEGIVSVGINFLCLEGFPILQHLQSRTHRAAPMKQHCVGALLYPW